MVYTRRRRFRQNRLSLLRLRGLLRPTTRGSRVGRFNSRRRIIRRALVRRSPRPEIKYIDLNTATTLGSGGNNTTNVTPLVLNRGTGVSLRIGSQVMFRKFWIKMDYSGPETTTVTGANEDNYIRAIFWTPRIDQAVAANYMNTMSSLDFMIDFNTVTVHKDIYIHLSAVNTTSNTNASSGAVAHFKHIEFSMPWPRKCHFPPSGTGIDSLDVDKDVLYVSHYNNFGGVTNWQFTSRVTYIDA